MVSKGKGKGKRKSSETEKVEKVEKIEKVEKKESGSGSVSFEELRDDLFREAAKLVSEDPSARIAILMTSPSSESDVSMHSFGHPSVEGVVQTFLEDKRPVPVPEEDPESEEMDDDDDDDYDEDLLPKRFWWEDEKLMNSKDPEELKAACDKIRRLQNHLTAVKIKRGLGSQEDLHNDEAGSKP